MFKGNSQRKKKKIRNTQRKYKVLVLFQFRVRIILYTHSRFFNNFQRNRIVSVTEIFTIDLVLIFHSGTSKTVGFRFRLLSLIRIISQQLLAKSLYIILRKNGSANKMEKNHINLFVFFTLIYPPQTALRAIINKHHS